MQNERSGARTQRKKRVGDVLSPQEAAAFDRGQTLKRVVRAAAALNDIYDDVALGSAVRRNRAAVGNWWRGARPELDVLLRLADVTGLSSDELTRFVYSDGPPPALPEPGSPAVSSVEEGVRLGRERQQRSTPSRPERLPRQRPRGTEATRE